MPRAKRAPYELYAKVAKAARDMRSSPTSAEAALWERLRAHRLDGLKFRRQHCIDRFIVDFYCASARLVVEVDGPIHSANPERDIERDAVLEDLGLNVVHVTNDEVLGCVDAVVERIRHAARS